MQPAGEGENKQPVAAGGVGPGIGEDAPDEPGAERRVVGLPVLHGPEEGDSLARAAELVTGQRCVGLGG